MVISTIQISLLTVIALLGIPVGFFLVHLTKEEMKDGRKWFKLLAIVSAVAFIVSFFVVAGEVLALLLTAFAFVFFISVVPLVRLAKKV